MTKKIKGFDRLEVGKYFPWYDDDSGQWVVSLSIDDKIYAEVARTDDEAVASAIAIGLILFRKYRDLVQLTADLNIDDSFNVEDGHRLFAEEDVE